MSMAAIAKFLRVNGSLYDGRDEGRWLALPGRKPAAPRYQLMQEGFGGEYLREMRLQRTFAGLEMRRSA